MAKFSPAGARLFVEHYARARRASEGGPFRAASAFAKAYMIDLLQEMLEAGVEMAAVPTHGRYFEIDTTEDWGLARRGWTVTA